MFTILTISKAFEQSFERWRHQYPLVYSIPFHSILPLLPTISLLHRPQAPPCRVEQLLLGLSLPSLNDRAGRTLALYNAKAMGAAPLPHGHFVGRRGLDQGRLHAGRFTFQHLSLVPRKDWFLARIHLCCSFWFPDQDEQF